MPDFYRPTPEDRRAFDKDGYLIVPGLLRRDEVDLLLKIARADRAMASEAIGRKDAEGNVSRLSLRNDLHDDMYSAVVRCRRTAQTTAELLGDEVYHFHHKMMLKEPKVGGAWEWHQDYGYWYRNNHCLYPDMVSCAVAVDRASRANGCMQLLKGTHKCGRIEHGITAEQVGADLERVEQLKKRHELVYAEMNPGDALFFHSNTLHRSDANRSDDPRRTLICCYNTKHNDPYDWQPDMHPAYHKLNLLDDDKVLEIGQKQWAGMEEASAVKQ